MAKKGNLKFKSYCWSLGTTSFRTKNFNKKIEEQLSLLNSFWSIDDNKRENWEGNNLLQEKYYNFMQVNGFVHGNANRKDKDARQKTSGLLDLGLIDYNRRLTEVGANLLKICNSNDFTSDNFLRIPKDSFIYLKQLLKTSVEINQSKVRPFIILIYMLSKLDYLTVDEFTYLLPLCIDENSTDSIINKICEFRDGKGNIDNIIVDVLLEKDNYNEALRYFHDNELSEELFCEIGLNRKSREYDSVYFVLYKSLYEVFYENKYDKASCLYDDTFKINIGRYWRNYIFSTSNAKAISAEPQKYFRDNAFQKANSEEEFKTTFFKVMHLLKAKATLNDYFDLNKRYIKTSGVVVFEDDMIKLDIVPYYFFNNVAEELYQEAYSNCLLLNEDCSLHKISESFIYDENLIIEGINKDYGVAVDTIENAYSIVESKRYERLNRLIDDKFPDEQLMALLEYFDNRNEDVINDIVTDNADIPTIFEYILGIIWYKISDRKGKILDYLKLSLDSDLLPISHAIGGDADIVYEYESSTDYPEHTLLLEATLADSTNQRRMEMEPVSRHLGNHLVRTKNMNSYCVFISNIVHINVVSDFRLRKSAFYFNPHNLDDYVIGLKIIPINTSDLRYIICHKIKYADIYKKFDAAFLSEENNPKTWYNEYVNYANCDKINQ
ncbi:MAG: AlwI family type II restriction endonuclease [Bacteroidales bacterium]|nr:AlwI family type II restriction endonuclease [Bacteroidales bacterium]